LKHRKRAIAGGAGGLLYPLIDLPGSHVNKVFSSDVVGIEDRSPFGSSKLDGSPLCSEPSPARPYFQTASLLKENKNYEGLISIAFADIGSID
jgi:hypothetical protein